MLKSLILGVFILLFSGCGAEMALTCQGAGGCKGDGTCYGVTTEKSDIHAYCVGMSSCDGKSRCTKFKYLDESANDTCDGFSTCEGLNKCEGISSCATKLLSCDGKISYNEDKTITYCDGVGVCEGKGTCEGKGHCGGEATCNGQGLCTGSGSCIGNGKCFGQGLSTSGLSACVGYAKCKGIGGCAGKPGVTVDVTDLDFTQVLPANLFDKSK